MNLLDKNRKKIIAKVNKLQQKGKYKKALDLVKYYRIADVTVTKGTLKNLYKLKPKEIENLDFIEIKNPHYSCSAPMLLFLIKQVEVFIERRDKLDSKPSKQKNNK